MQVQPFYGLSSSIDAIKHLLTYKSYTVGVNRFIYQWIGPIQWDLYPPIVMHHTQKNRTELRDESFQPGKYIYTSQNEILDTPLVTQKILTGVDGEENKTRVS